VDAKPCVGGAPGAAPARRPEEAIQRRLADQKKPSSAPAKANWLAAAFGAAARARMERSVRPPEVQAWPSALKRKMPAFQVPARRAGYVPEGNASRLRT